MLEYDKYIVTFSGGKDSTVLLLFLLDNGVHPSKIELWHHDIDGQGETFMDWEITPDYCFNLAEAFKIPIYFSWKQGGFKGELLKENNRTAPTIFENQFRETQQAGGLTGKIDTRRKFPQITASLKQRWCSSVLKIDVCATAVRNQERFNDIKTVVLSGERGEESPARAKYKVLENHRSDLRDGKKYRRHVDHWRPIRDWTEKQIWDIIERYRINVHPCYYLGWNRCSCKFCIFGNANQFRSAQTVSPVQCAAICKLENEFQCTIKRNKTLPELLKSGKEYPGLSDKQMVKLATSFDYTESIFTNNWKLPSGAFGENAGSA